MYISIPVPVLQYMPMVVQEKITYVGWLTYSTAFISILLFRLDPQIFSVCYLSCEIWIHAIKTICV